MCSQVTWHKPPGWLVFLLFSVNCLWNFPISEREKDVILLGNNFNLYATFFLVLSTSDKGNRLIDVFSGITDANYKACAKLLCSS